MTIRNGPCPTCGATVMTVEAKSSVTVLEAVVDRVAGRWRISSNCRSVVEYDDYGARRARERGEALYDLHRCPT